MPADYTCYVINLRREPGRYETMKRRMQRVGIEHVRFEAIEGAACREAELVSAGILAPGTTGYTPGAVGCASSHRELWRRCVETGRTFLVLEDDIAFRLDFRRHVDEILDRTACAFDVILLGYNTSSVLDVRLSEICNLEAYFSNLQPTPRQLEAFSDEATESGAPQPSLLRLNSAFGFCAYLVSSSGARKLDALFPMDNRPVFIPSAKKWFGADTFRCMTIDMLANTIYRHMRAYAVVPPLVVPQNDVSGTRDIP